MAGVNNPSHRRQTSVAATSISSERPPAPSALAAALREPADLGRGAAAGNPLLLPSFCRGVILVGSAAGAGLGLPSGASATLAFL